jgi:hypothetical protein
MVKNKKNNASAGSSATEKTVGSVQRGLVPGLVLGVAILLVAIVLVGLGLSGRSIALPEFAVSRVEARANKALGGQAAMTVGSAELVVSQDFLPQIRWRNVTLRSPAGRELAQITALRTTLDAGALLKGQLQPRRFALDGARVALRRGRDGALEIAPGATGFSGKSFRPVDILDTVRRAFDLPVLSGITSIKVTRLDVLWDDARSGQVWTIRDSALTLVQDDQKITVDVSFDLSGQTGLEMPRDAQLRLAKEGGGLPLARATFALTADKISGATRVNAQVAQVSARDLAGHLPALAWLAAIDAPISGSISTGISAQGSFEPLEADLDLAAGALRPTQDTRPIAFDSAHLGLSFDPASSELTLRDLRIDSPALRTKAVGKAYLSGPDGGVPDTLVGQVQLREFEADPEGLFATAVTFNEGWLDLKLELAPFRLTLGQLVLVDRGHKISAQGEVAAEAEGWAVALDVAIDAIETKRLLTLWPLSAVPKTRLWLQENVATGELFDVKAALRLRPGAEPRLALGYQFRGAEVKFLKTLPPIVDGSGYATIEDYDYTLVVDKGQVRAPRGGSLDVAGTVIKVPDIRVIPANAEITLKSESSVTAALAILDEPPFRFLSKAGQPVDLAEGRADIVAKLRLKLIKDLKPGDVSYVVKGKLRDVWTDQIVKGRVLRADELDVTADPAKLEISGSATLDDVPLTAGWSQALGPEAKGKSQVTGVIEISPKTLETFAISLPDGAITGQAKGAFTLDLARDRQPSFRLESDLVGAAMRIPEVSWTKAKGQSGKLEVTGQFGTPARIDRFSLEAAGLKAPGKIVLSEAGAFARAEFTGASLDGWFDGDITLTGRGAGRAVAVDVTAGRVDLRRARFGPPGGAGDDTAPLEVALDQLRVSDSIRLTGFRGSFSSNGGMRGDFSGNVNGGAAITGRMEPSTSGRSAFRLRSNDAGAAMAAAGIYESGRGGVLSLDLRPVGAEGTYDGTLGITGIRVVNAPELAGLLNAISVVGLINQLQGTGIVFSDVAGKFRLTPDAVEIREGSAVGAALGVSAAGVYGLGNGQLDFQGVISPIYVLNGVGQIFSRQRDGLFGFNYRLTGTKEATKVSVNPLSILTPGMFRNLFRKAPPTIEP